MWFTDVRVPHQSIWVLKRSYDEKESVVRANRDVKINTASNSERGVRLS